MKFVSDPDGLLKKIARGEGGGKSDLSRYMAVDKLEVPSEQVDTMKQTCRTQAAELRQQAQAVRQKGNDALADKLETQANNYTQLEEKIADAGMSTEEAINYRLNPRWETAKDIASVSHQAGMEGAKFGAAIGGSISLISQLIAVYSGNKELEQALLDTAKDTLVSAGVGYGSAFVGSAIKACMQQSESATTRALAKTGLPATIVSVCLATGQSIRRYAKGDIDETQLMQEMGLTASGMLSASMFTMLGQIAIPVPVLGGLIGGMVGYTLSNNFYQTFFDTLNEAQLSAQRRQLIEMKCSAARALARQYETSIKHLFAHKLQQLDAESTALFALLDAPEIDTDEFCAGMNRFAALLGKTLSINDMDDLDRAMLSDEPLII